MPLEATLELPIFQGPLDLLLNLIERRQLEIADVSLAAVTDQYLQAVRALPEPDADLLGEFLVIGARLLLLKSRLLLPREVEPDEEESVDDLAERLEEYRRFKEAAVELAARFDSGQHAFPHPLRPELENLQPPLEPLDAQVLAQLWKSITRRQPPATAAEPSLQPRVSVGTRVIWLQERLTANGSLFWHDLASETLDELIATFLAVLELIRRRELNVRQERSFGPIRLERAAT